MPSLRPVTGPCLLLGAIRGGRWYPEIGDPTPMGWFTVCAYLITALLCALCAVCLAQRSQDDRTGGLIWAVIALIMICLGINKQLDLQSWVTILGKDLARHQGWYAYRRWVQLFFVLAIMGLVAAGLTAVGPILKRQVKSAFFGLIGLGFLGSFIIVRAASFHHIDRWIGLSLGGVRVNWILELGGITAIAIAALVNLLSWHKS